jgi:hypothetical protein
MSIFVSTILVNATSTLWLGDLYPRKTSSSDREKKHGMSKRTRRMASVWGPMLRLLLVVFQSENLCHFFIALKMLCRDNGGIQVGPLSEELLWLPVVLRYLLQ